MSSRVIQQETNDRIYSRNHPSHNVANPISFRPVITKYTRVVAPLPDAIDAAYTSFTFIPGDRKSPWTGYKQSVDIESSLRDQTTRIGDTRMYSPNVFGDLYNAPMPINGSANIPEFPYLIQQDMVGGSAVPIYNQPFAFYNSSRTNR